ncbi:MAG: hypothetical protein EWV83_22095 [Microcystis sp. M_OC_Ca_00000000_S217Cul]|nr:MAG: hypothetical protein EWV83_22095 [Microcystis sp. M_OC_Ca_00000000_S217Cul]TRT88819.1 MAG: hypothetical protein EWV66_11480 [Microcystis sp. M_OC_Ca_00000000_C217Col]
MWGVGCGVWGVGRINKNNLPSPVSRLLSPDDRLLSPDDRLLNLKENINFRAPGDFQPVLGFNVVIGG